MTEVLVDPIRVALGLYFMFMVGLFIGLYIGRRFPTRAIKQELLFMGHREDEQERGRARIQDEIARRRPHPQDLDEPHYDGYNEFERFVVASIRAIRSDITLAFSYMEELMVTQLSDIQAAADAAKASADRANANIEKLLAKVDQLAVDLKNALASGSDPVVLAAIAAELAGVSGSLDAESAKVDGDANVNPVAQAAPAQAAPAGPGVAQS